MEIEKKAKFTTQLISPRKLDILLFCMKNWGFRDDHTEGRMEIKPVGERGNNAFSQDLTKKMWVFNKYFFDFVKLLICSTSTKDLWPETLWGNFIGK